MRNFKHTEDQPRWIFKKHTNNMNLLLEVATYLIKTEMESAVETQVPLLVEVGVGKNWLEAH